ncbi:MAG: MFS transporter, partial [Xanthobacteraceae bacterium]
MRMTLLVVPPIIPLVHQDLHMSETQIGLLIGVPLAMFAIAAVPGSLLIARIGAKPALILGMTIAALAGA